MLLHSKVIAILIFFVVVLNAVLVIIPGSFHLLYFAEVYLLVILKTWVVLAHKVFVVDLVHSLLVSV